VVVVSIYNDRIICVTWEQMLLQMLLVMHRCKETCWGNFGCFGKFLEILLISVRMIFSLKIVKFKDL